MSAPGPDSFRSRKSKHTFANSNDVFLQKQGYGFIPLSQGPVEFVCVCTNPRPTSYSPPVPHWSALHGLQNKRKTNLLAKGYNLMDCTGDTRFGNLETGVTRKSSLLVLI